MTDFIAFFKIGLGHILDLEGVDHLLFIASIVLAYTIADWKVLLRLITAFTLGHLISMELGYYAAIPLSRTYIEFLIPFTILISSIYHLWSARGSVLAQFMMIGVFGLIHGAAYSSEFMSMMGRSPEILLPLLGFNLGVEIAQLIFGLCFLFVIHFIFRSFPLWKRGMTILIFGLIICMSLNLAIKSWPW